MAKKSKERKPVVDAFFVKHQPHNLKPVLASIKQHIKPGQEVGLEIDPEEIKVFEDILVKQALTGIHFTDAYRPHFFDRALEIMKRFKPAEEAEALIKESKQVMGLNQGRYLTEIGGNIFMFSVYKALKGKGVKVIPLDTKAMMMRLGVLKYKVALERDPAKQEALDVMMQYLNKPSREYRLFKRLKTMPRSLIIGSGHFEGVKYWLNQKGFDLRVRHHDQAPELITELGKVFREIYLKRLRERSQVASAKKKKKKKRKRRK